MSLELGPITRDAANAYVKAHHRHHGRVVGHVFALAARVDGETVGVAIVGRPIARHLQDGVTAEITRVATNGHRNACSVLYGACARAARALGYRRIITYTLESELGASLRGAGWKATKLTRAESHDRPSRRRTDKHPTCAKIRWEVSP